MAGIWDSAVYVEHHLNRSTSKLTDHQSIYRYFVEYVAQYYKSSLSLQHSFDQQNLTASLTLVAANYSDIGAYRCTAMIDGESVSQATLYLQIDGMISLTDI